MPHLRFDPTTTNWVVFSPSRRLRPREFTTLAESPAETPEEARNGCPFCPGNESETPPEIFAVRFGNPADVSGWSVRVVSNRYPALQIELDTTRHHDGRSFLYMGGCGAHEVLISTPEHSKRLEELPVEQIELILRTAQLRYQDLMRDQRFQTVVIFKNWGERAGTSLKHPHWQLIATPVVPHSLRLKFQIASDYFDTNGECLYCVLRDEEIEAKQRIVAQNSDFVAFIPYASHVPFEIWILPMEHHSSFEMVQANQLTQLADILKNVLLKLNLALDDLSYNLTIDVAPRGDEDKLYFLWHMRILPKLMTPAGFELGSGMSINTVLPEEAAEFLRKVPLSTASSTTSAG